MNNTFKTFFAVAVDAEGSAFVTSRVGEDWRYQDVCGVGGRVLYEGPDEGAAQDAALSYIHDRRPVRGEPACPGCGCAWHAEPGEIPVTDYEQTTSGFFLERRHGETIPCTYSHGRDSVFRNDHEQRIKIREVLAESGSRLDSIANRIRDAMYRML